MTDAELVRRYGPGENVEDVRENHVVDYRSRCYFDSAQGVWLLADIYHNNNPPHMYVVGVKVSAQPLCKKPGTPKKPFQMLALKRGLAIGSSESEVLQQCGKPSRIDDSVAREKRDPRYQDIPGYGARFGKRALNYFPEGEDSLLMLSVQVTDGKVVTLWLNDSP